MLPKKLINKCLFRLNNTCRYTCRYTNVNYTLHIRNDYISINVYIYEPDKIKIIKSFYRIVKDEYTFNRFFNDVADFINENKKFIIK